MVWFFSLNGGIAGSTSLSQSSFQCSEADGFLQDLAPPTGVLRWVCADVVTHIRSCGCISTRFSFDLVQQRVKHPNLAFVGGTVIVAIMAIAVFVGGANAGDCPRSPSVEATSLEGHHKADQTAEVEA